MGPNKDYYDYKLGSKSVLFSLKLFWIEVKIDYSALKCWVELKKFNRIIKQ